MGKNLIIVESGGKISKIEKILSAELGPDWIVKASGGHIRDMAKGDGFDDKTLEINYEMTEQGKINLNKIKPHVEDADMVVLASDPDREGEAIADHLRTCLNLKPGKYKRCVFREITSKAILDAINNPGEIQEDLVTAQRFRRITDRAVGYRSTKALQVKTGLWMPIGRVQTPALGLVVARDRAIENHTVKTHYSVRLKTRDNWFCTLNTKLSKLGDPENHWVDEEKAQTVATSIKDLRVIKSETTSSKSTPPNAFKTTTLQKAGINALGVSGEEVMNLASVLFEQGYITYIRTDDESMSTEGYEGLCDYVKKNRPDLDLFGSKRAPTGKKAANAQEAHECIRAVDFNIDAIEVSGVIEEKHAALYKIIHQRAVASQLKDAVSEGVKLTLEGQYDGADYIFEATHSSIIYMGWKALTAKDNSLDDDESDAAAAAESESQAAGKVPLLNKGQIVVIENGQLIKKETKPSAPYTETTLISAMEKAGIGRPSTYQSIVKKLTKGHAYIDIKTKNKRKILVSNDNGRRLIDSIEDSLGQSILHIGYTQEMEDSLDEVANGCDNPNQIMFDFLKRLEEENADLMRNPIHLCKIYCCNGSMVRGISKKSKTPYWICISPSCKTIVGDDNMKPGISYAAQKEEAISKYSNLDGSPMHPCPKCQSHVISVTGKFGVFWKCSNDKDSKCDYKAPDDEGKPMSSEKLAAKRKAQEEVIKRSTTDNGEALWNCIKCNSMILKRKSAKNGNWWFACSSRKCDARYWPTDLADDNCEPRLDAVIDDSKKKLSPEKLAAKKKAQEEVIKRSTTDKGEALWKCIKCNSMILKRKNAKNGNWWFACSSRKCDARYWPTDIKNKNCTPRLDAVIDDSK